MDKPQDTPIETAIIGRKGTITFLNGSTLFGLLSIPADQSAIHVQVRTGLSSYPKEAIRSIAWL